LGIVGIGSSLVLKVKNTPVVMKSFVRPITHLDRTSASIVSMEERRIALVMLMRFAPSNGKHRSTGSKHANA